MSKVSSIKAIIEAHKGQFFGVSFVKQNGELRTIKNAQVGIKQGHTGENSVAHIEKYVTVVENLGGGKFQHRNIGMDKITRLAIGGKIYEWEEDANE